MVHTVHKFNQATSFLNGLVVHVVLGHLCQTCHVTDTNNNDLLKLLFHPRPKLKINKIFPRSFYSCLSPYVVFQKIVLNSGTMIMSKPKKVKEVLGNKVFLHSISERARKSGLMTLKL